MNKQKHRTVEYGKYGYIFIAPFFIVYLIFQFWPLLTTFYYSTLLYEKRNLKETITFGGLANFVNLLGLGNGEKAYFLLYFGNTVIIWLCNFVPQIVISLLMAAWLSDDQVLLKGRGLYKCIIYLPSLITAASISVLFNAMFGAQGPVTMTLRNMGIISAKYDFMQSVAGTRGIISYILFWMWYGNTSILLISGVLGISPDIYEAADIDGAGSAKKFFSITLPLLKPILLYVLITSLIGGLQNYDIPALFNVSTTGYIGQPDDKSTTLTMYIMRLYQSQVGKAAAVSVLLFVITLIASLILLYTMGDKDARKLKKEQKRLRKAGMR
ncbi:MAG: sugar ABC transporter permease [Lachnospiraceae bacterium]|jgi:ABC-type sugar transport system permease subunit|nr:sugar ABC transporter permease [Lachnospiraceae bacterium]MEE3460674.1 sugar ABC transporter permease [Lachnospiraceae bacterium]